MIVLLASFTLLLIMSSTYSVIVGGRPARLACGMMVIATIASQLVTLDANSRVPLMAVDTVLLIGLIAISLFSKSYWPLWVAGIQASAEAANFALLLSRPIDLDTFHAIVGFWSIPIFLVMPLGIYLDRRASRHAKEPGGRVGQFR